MLRQEILSGDVIQKHGLRMLTLIIDSGCLQLGDFTLPSGLKSKYKMVFENLVGNEENFHQVCRIVCEYIQLKGYHFDTIVGVVPGGAVTGEAVAKLLGKNFATRFGENEGLEERKQIQGNISPRDKILVLDEVTDSGDNVRSCVQRIIDEVSFPDRGQHPLDESGGIVGNVVGAISLFDYGLGAKAGELKIDFISDFEDLIQALKIDPQNVDKVKYLIK